MSVRPRPSAAALVIALLLAFPGGCAGPRTPPDDERVSRALEELKQEKIAALQEEARREHVTSQIALWLRDGRFYIRLLVVSAVTAAIIALLVFLILILIRLLRFRRVAVGRRRDQPGGEPAGPAALEPSRLRELEAAGRYGEAVLVLHRLTVRHLAERNVLKMKNLTNHTILARLSDGALARVFRLIAETSERVLFDRAEVSAGEFARCRDAYASAFREGRR